LVKPPGFTSFCLVSNTVAFTTSEGSWLDQSGSRALPARTAGGLSSASPDGQWLAMYRPFGTSLYVYRLPGVERVAKLGPSASIGSVKFSPAGDEVAICSSLETELWRTGDWQRIRKLPNVRRLLYTSDPRVCWLTRDLRTAGLYDARTLELLLPLPAGTLPLGLSADGRYVAVSIDARRLQVWDIVEVRKQLRELGTDWALKD
jgi:WD40 repeat protein